MNEKEIISKAFNELSERLSLSASLKQMTVTELSLSLIAFALYSGKLITAISDIPESVYTIKQALNDSARQR